MNNKQLYEMIDALRPGSDDLKEPEMAELASHLAQDDQAATLRRHIEQADRRIAEAFHQVSVPSGLAERLIAGCTAEVSKQKDPETAAPIEVAPPSMVPSSMVPSSMARRSGRRRFFAFGVALSTTAAIALFAVSLFKPVDEPLTADVVLDSALHFFVEKDSQPATGQPLRDAPTDFPIADRDIRVPPGTLWRRLDAFAGNGSMIAYDLTTRHNPGRNPGRNPIRATLYVLRVSVEGLPTTASPDRPDRQTLGSCVMAWQQEGLVYVLVVRGKTSDYRQFFKSTSRTLVAMR